MVLVQVRHDGDRDRSYNGRMRMVDPHVLKSRRYRLPEELAYVEMLCTADVLTRGIVPLLKAEELSLAQYNVLRILNGSPAGLPCGEIGERMITRDPDITRLLDRLEKRKLILRTRELQDRRRVLSRITPEGRELLLRMNGAVRQVHRKQLGHLGRERLKTLTELLRAARTSER
jgi:DNA-binding MarR family transcriptional regulator